MTHDAATLAGRLSKLVQIPTVTPSDAGPLTSETAQTFDDLHALLRELYPTLFATAEVTAVGRAGLLLRISGTGEGTGATVLGTVLLMAHQDVVPAPTEGWEAAGWAHPPFAGIVEDSEDGLTVYGRGTLDDKGALLVLLEGVEDLLGDGWHPHDDLYLSLGGDEESDGPSAVAAIDELERRGVAPALVVDEGGAVTTGLLPGLTKQVAVVGVAEKGVVNLEVSVLADPRKPAHASTPPRRSPTAALGRALAALEQHPHPAALDDIAVRMFTELAPYVPGPLSAFLARSDQLRRVLAQVFPYVGAEMAAMVRTTTAATMLTGSSAPNVLAAKATAVVNMRVATSSNVADAIRHVEKVVRRAVGSALTVELRVLEGHEPTPTSPFDERWDALRRAVAASYPDALTVPYTMLGASDARHAARIAPAVYRFSPLYMSSAQRASVHGVDERVAADSLVKGVRFYRALLAGTA
jgi:carboxypeptidase PM20D1